MLKIWNNFFSIFSIQWEWIEVKILIFQFYNKVWSVKGTCLYQISCATFKLQKFDRPSNFRQQNTICCLRDSKQCMRSSPANVLKGLSRCSSLWLGSWLHAVLFFCRQYALHVLARFLYLSVHRHFVITTTLHLYTFHFSTYLFSCQYIANTPSSFFYLPH